MNKVVLKQWEECQRLQNVITTITGFLNNAIDDKKRAKKNKDANALEIAKKNILKYECDLNDVRKRLYVAETEYNLKSIECAIRRTKVYVLSYSLQGAVFDLREFLRENATHDGGEVDFIEKLKECSDTLMTMPIEFGRYGKDNESYNICEEIISNSVDEGVRAVFDEMINRDTKYGNKTP